MDNLFSSTFSPVIGTIFALVKAVLFLALGGAGSFLVVFFLKYQLDPRTVTPERLKALSVRNKWFDLFRWVLFDFLDRKNHKDDFEPFGMTIYVGVQGDGKSISMVNDLDMYKARYPNCVIVCNFKYDKADYTMVDWEDLLHVRNGEQGVIFAIDEIHSEYSSASYKDVPEYLLSEISQQRKQKIKILASSQFFSRIAKPVREQARDVVVCNTYFKRLTVNRRYNAYRYATVLDNPGVVRKKLKPLSHSSFVQSNALRSEYDTYEKINRMRDRQKAQRKATAAGK